MKFPYIQLFMLLGIGSAEAQTIEPFTTETPRWIKSINDSSANVNKTTDAFFEYVATHPGAEKKKYGTKRIVNTFLHWRNKVQPFTSLNGKVDYPTMSQMQRITQQVNASNRSSEKIASNTLQWNLVGPFKIFNKKRGNIGPHQSNIQRFDIYQKDANILYCGTETGMVYTTKDKGLHWTACSPKFYFGGEIKTVNISPDNADLVVVGGGPFLWLTNNGGQSWKDITPRLNTVFAYIRDVTFDPNNSKHLFCGTDSGLYESLDNGLSWRLCSSGRVFDIKYTHQPQEIFAIQAVGNRSERVVKIQKSTDNGATFTTIQLPCELAAARLGIGKTTSYVFGTALDKYYDTEYFRGAPKLLFTNDHGNSWNERNVALPINIADDKVFGGQGYYDMDISVDNENDQHIIYGFTNVYQSLDGGVTATNIGGYTGTFDLHPDLQEVRSQGNDTWVATDGGMIYSSDFFKSHAETRTVGIYSSEFWGFDQGWNEDIAVGGRNHNGNLVLMPEKWDAAAFLGGSEMSTGYVFLSNSRKISFSDNEGGSGVIVQDDYKNNFPLWQGFYQMPYENTRYGLSFCQDPRYAQRFFISSYTGRNDDHPRRKLWLTQDDGNTFTNIYTFDEDIQSYDISRVNPNKIYVGTNTKLYQSTDGGNSFSSMKLPEELKEGGSFLVVTHPTDENQIWLSSRNPEGIMMTSDDGQTWTDLRQGLKKEIDSKVDYNYSLGYFFLTGNDKNAAYGIAINNLPFNNSGGSYQVAKMVYRDNTTGSWIDISDGLANYPGINKIRPFYMRGKLRIGTKNGIWERSLNDSVFVPIAQPVALNKGNGFANTADTIQLDSYSIVNQNEVSWEWKITPKPMYISDSTIRNPKVVFGAPGKYNVSLTVTTPQGSNEKTIPDMFEVSGQILTGLLYSENDPIIVPKRIIKQGENFVVNNTSNHALNLLIYTTQGKLLNSFKINNGLVQLSTNQWPKGTLVYKLKNKTFNQFGKILIQ